MVAGITQVVFAFSLKVSLAGRVLLFISGAAALVLAVMCFINFGDAVLLLAIWIGIGFIEQPVSGSQSSSAQGEGGQIWKTRISSEASGGRPLSVTVKGR